MKFRPFQLSSEKWLIVGLGIAVTVQLSLVGLLLHAWQLSPLAVMTWLFLLSYPLCWGAWKIWRYWSLPWQRISNYTQSLSAGESNRQLLLDSNSQLQQSLVEEINRLAHSSSQQQRALDDLYLIFQQLFEQLPIATWAFDKQNKLVYCNEKAQGLSTISSLTGSTARDLGFVVSQYKIAHPALSDDWHCQHSELHMLGHSLKMLFAMDISLPLTQNEHMVQNNLVRVLSHELRNSLTPISSLADTLLSQQQWQTEQVVQVLNRVRSRADGLLDFVNRFASVAKIPEIKSRWFEFNDLVEQTRVLAFEPDSIEVIGNTRCHGDPELLGQVLVNLVKNAFEAIAQDKVPKVQLHYLIEGNNQIIRVIDNGQGFVNLDNAQTPLYTTKPQGSGIGLAFAGAVLNKHGGQVKLANLQQGGACVELIWPSAIISGNEQGVY